MPHPYLDLVRPVTLWVLFFLTVAALIVAAGNYGGQPQPSPEPEYVRGKIVRIQIDVEFKANLDLSSPNHLVGDEIVWRKPPMFVLFLGTNPDTPLEKCREVYVEKSVFLSVKIGGKYRLRGLIEVQPPPRR